MDFLGMRNRSARSSAPGQPDLTPILPSEYKGAEAIMERKVGWSSARGDLCTGVTEPRY